MPGFPVELSFNLIFHLSVNTHTHKPVPGQISVFILWVSLPEVRDSQVGMRYKNRIEENRTEILHFEFTYSGHLLQPPDQSKPDQKLKHVIKGIV